MQHPRDTSKLSPGALRSQTPATTPSPAPSPANRPLDPGLRSTVAFEQVGVPDAAPQAAIRPAPARVAAGRKPARHATVAYDQGAFQEPAGRQTLAYDREAFEEPGAPRTTAYGEHAPAASAAAAPAGPGQAVDLGVAATADAADAGFAGLGTAATLVDPRAAHAGGSTASIGGADLVTPAMDVTVAAGGATGGATGAGAFGMTGAPAATEARSTVLPHVELVGQDVQLRRAPRPRYEAVGPLGEGGVGLVVKANDNDIGRQVALKKLRPEQQGPSVLLRFVDEIRTVGQLEHPNIVPIHDVGLDSHGEYYFVMKYVDGETIETIIDRLASGDREAHRQYPFERRVDIFRSVLEAIRFAHTAGIIHRDIKPANVMVGRYGEVVVMDWGLAKRVREPTAAALDEARAAAVLQAGAAAPAPGGPFGMSPPPKPRSLSRPAVGSGSAMALQTQLGAVLGTPAYMSPEQARGEPLDVRSDIYSLCLMLHEFLCLRHPLADKRSLDEVLRAVIAEPVPMTGAVRSPHQHPPGMDLSWFVRKGLHKDPAKRYQSVDEMIERLRLRSQGIIPIECHLTFVKRVTGFWIRLSERFPLAFSLGMLLLIGAVIASVVRLVI